MSSDAESSGVLSQDLVFEILSNTRRRMVLYYLRQNDGMATIKELAEQIAALENDVDVDALGRQQRKRVYVSLYQTHVPKLEDAGIIHYDDGAGEVRLTNRADEFDSYLTTPTQWRYPWRLHYLGMAAVGGLLFGLSYFGIASISTVLLGAGLVVAFAISAGVQYWRHVSRGSEVPSELLRHDE